MNKNILKSIGAVLAGFVLVVILSIATDLILVNTGIMQQPFHLNSSMFIVFVVLYRCSYSIIGTYLTARLAPNKPILHAMIGGVIGLILSIVGAITMWDQPPHWYAIALIITALPCAWLGGKIFITSKKAY
ncbi:MAG: hypothetical protein V4683_09130 [Bacteroidota bacterium]